MLIKVAGSTSNHWAACCALGEHQILLSLLCLVFIRRCLLRNLEYLEGQLEGHRLVQRNKMELADKYDHGIQHCSVT